MNFIDMITTYAFSFFGIICIIAGAVVLFLGVRQFFNERRHCTLSAMAIVKEVMYNHDTFTNEFDPDEVHTPTYGLKLIVDIDGTEHEVFNEEYSSDLNRYREGDAVRIKINPNNLNEYYVDDGHMTSGIFITVVGIALIGAGIYFLKYFRM